MSHSVRDPGTGQAKNMCFAVTIKYGSSDKDRCNPRLNPSNHECDFPHLTMTPLYILKIQKKEVSLIVQCCYKRD